MGPSPPSLIASLRSYYDEGQTRAFEDLNLNEPEGGPATTVRKQADYELRLDQAIRELRARVKEQETALAELRTSSRVPPLAQSSDQETKLTQLRAIKEAFTSLAFEPPYIPPSDSPLAVLLALRHNYQLIASTSASIKSVQSRLDAAQSRLQAEESTRSDCRLIAQALESRIQALRAAQIERANKTPSQIAKELLRDLQRKKSSYERETKRLVKAFNVFIDDHLAAMLAAEELGGPVVGSLVDVQDITLQAGFSQQGKARKIKSSLDGEKRQRRIDEIWGPKNDDEDMEGGRSEKEAAGAEMRILTEKLLNASSSSSSSSSAGGYVVLERDSAAARFLVRAKVAQFHPRDAMRLRLIDFGRDLDEY